MIRFIFLLLFLVPLYSYGLVETENKQLEKKINKHFEYKVLSKKKLEQYLIKNSYFKFRILRRKNNYIVENPIKTMFVIKGNSFLNEKNLQQIIQIEETELGVNLYETIKGKIKSVYQREGFQRVAIQQKIKRIGWQEWLYLYIQEGSRIRIAKILILGVFSKPSSEYINFIINNSSPLIKKGFYNKQDLNKGYQALISNLKATGFLQSKFYTDRVIIKNNLATIKVTLEEGPLTIIKDIDLKNFRSIPIGEILSHMKLKVQSPLNLNLFNQDLNRMEEIYKSKGFLESKIKNKGITYEQNKQYANLQIEMEEGPQSIVSNILVEGLKKAKLDLIFKLLHFQIGNILTPKKIEDSKKALISTGLFSKASILYENISTDETEVTIKLKERKLRSIRGGMGINSERGITTRLYTEFDYKNLFGWGRNLFFKLGGQTSITNITPFFEYELSGGYKEIFIPGKNYEGSISISKSKDIFNFSKKNIYAIRKNQISFFIDKRIQDNIHLNWNTFNLEDRKEDCIGTKCPENLQRIGSSSFTFTLDNRDNIFNPKKGYFLSFLGEVASPYLQSSENINFWKIHFQNQIYHSFLNDDYTLALAFKTGMIQATEEIPVSRSFILGGQTSIRGYDGNIEGERIPKSDFVPIKTANESLKLMQDNSIEPVLMSAYGLFKWELRFPISRNFKSLIFYDAGAVFMRGKENDLIDYGHSTGIGFRYETFILPVGLDIGYKLPPKTGADYRFHFSIGVF